ncbi:MAG: hypothetical protein DI535_18185 [Citrobacter freundii]|nr:MAG: hypothetical protein DI535_18185 [Citrobacter freundii]
MIKLLTLAAFATYLLLSFTDNRQQSVYNDRFVFPLKKNTSASLRQELTDADENDRHRLISEYRADLDAGSIGSIGEMPDDPYDNVFHIKVNHIPSTKTIAWLSYEVFGVKGSGSVGRSINDGQATGGSYIQKNAGWTFQKEQIPVSTLKTGDNVIRFGIQDSARHNYSVRNITLTIEELRVDAVTEIIAEQPVFDQRNNQAYIKGLIRLPQGETLDGKLFCNGIEVPVYDAQFEIIMPGSATSFSLEYISAKQVIKEIISAEAKRFADIVYDQPAKTAKAVKQFLPGKNLELSNFGVSLNVPAHALSQAVEFSVTRLRNIDIPALNSDLVNVTAGGSGFRFLPHGTQFKQPVHITIPFDSTLIPEGYSFDDIRTYYFDDKGRQWVPLSLDTIIAGSKRVISNTTHFTDMINAIIKVPESPQTQGYTPTSIKDIKAANPSQGITLIDPPAANNTGSASLGYALKLPGGRQDMQPSLAIRYNSEGGNSWLGKDWNLSVSSIGIDTRRGVPRYDADLETEAYTLNGEPLAPEIRYGSFLPRSAEKVFHLRAEGSFNRIVRHGNHPSGYWWEVTEKDGTSHFYGGTPETGFDNSSVLKDDAGNVANWALTMTRDLNDNFVRYSYITIVDSGLANGTVPGRQMYLRTILYTGHRNADGGFEVYFERDRDLREAKRKDIEINARLGFKMVTADLLRRIYIRYGKTVIRYYDLQYQTGVFNKTLLKNISEYNGSGGIFYTHEFSYYNDVDENGNFSPLGATENWSPANDNIENTNISLTPPLFSKGTSALGASRSSGASSSIAITLGIWDGNVSKSNTVGGSFGSGSNTTEGMLALIDINGDGLPDKLFKKGGALQYRPNLGLARRQFGDLKPVTGITNFSYSNSRSTTRGIEANLFSFFLGRETNTTYTTTTQFLTDFNGDGLIDLADNGKVLFNRMDANRNPLFLQGSDQTPSPIFTSNLVDPELLSPDTAYQAQLERDHPLQDAVRYWQAPFDGKVHIEAPVRLLNMAQPGITDNKLDGVRLSIQYRNSVLWKTVISPGDFSDKTPMIADFDVTRGQKIYFRLQSIYNGNNDVVQWDPLITYLSNDTKHDADGRSVYRYRASEDFILHNNRPYALAKKGEIEIKGSFRKGITSDSVKVMIVKKSAGINIVVREYAFAAGETVNFAISIQEAVEAGDSLRFILHTDSHIDRKKTEWRPEFLYTSFADGNSAVDGNGDPIIRELAIPDHTNFNDWIGQISGYPVRSADSLSIWPKLKLSASASGTLTFTVKGTDTIYGKRHLIISGGNIAGSPDSIRIRPQMGEQLFYEYHAADRKLIDQWEILAAICHKDTVITRDNKQIDTIISRDYNAGLYANPAIDYMGSLFRGWGQFSFKGDQSNAALDEGKLNLDNFESFSNDPSLYSDPEQLGNVADVSQTEFIPMYAYQPTREWRGFDTSVYVRDSTMGSARLWVHDVKVDALMEGASLSAVNKISKSNSTNISFGVDVLVTNVSATTSSTSTKNVLDMMDLNGDRHPDIINGRSIQYTLPNGGLESVSRLLNTGEATFQGTATAVSLGGGGSLAQANAKNNPPANALNISVNTEASIGLSGSINSTTNKDNVENTWIDMNGDGLPDRVYANGMVALNLGYRFAPIENWGFSEINKNTSQQYTGGGGLGGNLFYGSFQFGLSLLRSESNGVTSFEDLNGDGLPDRLTIGSGQVFVQLNTGTGFGPIIPWSGLGKINYNTSMGQSSNQSFTIAIPIPIIIAVLKLCINPGFSSSNGVSRENQLMADIDGDGYPDLLQSDNDGNLTARRSTMRRTNLLRNVTRPMGGSFSLDYERAGNTYDMPHNKWVLASVEVFDGLRGDGVDITRQRFVYEDGYYDRDEREFLGFGTVVSQQLNSAANDLVYRSSTRKFLNRNFYAKGLITQEFIADANGRKYTQTEYVYESRTIMPGVIYLPQVETRKQFFESAPTAGASTFTRINYDNIGNPVQIADAGDGSQQDLLIANISYHNNDQRYIKNIPSRIEVTTSEGLKRKRETDIYDNGSIKQIRQYLDDSIAVYDLKYDTYGNLTEINRPNNYRGQRMWYRYQYDPAVQTYVTKVEDAFGYSSSSSYDIRFGELLSTTSMNNETVRYQLDDFGRLSSITGPYELAAGKPYTIAFEYYYNAATPYAITRHFDPHHGGDINTITFMDGLGRPVQIKKLGSLFKDKSSEDELRMVVSGKNIFDAFGRVIRSYYPVSESIGTINNQLNTTLGALQETNAFDILDRPVATQLADGSTTLTSYIIRDGLMATITRDALQHVKETLKDVRNRTRITNALGGPDGTITTRFSYNALDELIRVTDAGNNTIESRYDNLGRKISVKHPDAGLTEYRFDLAGNLVKKITAQIRKEIPDNGGIDYRYDYERLTDIDYPRQYQNKVRYTYGKPGMGNRIGRLILQEDASGGCEYFYGRLGEVTKTIRTIMVNSVYYATYVSEQEYDTWNRITKMTYADGEVVNYHYNKAGNLYSIDGEKAQHNYSYVERIGYDEYEQRVYLRYGNGTETNYTYDPQRRRLSNLQVMTKSGRAIMDNHYRYDAVSNILGITNNVEASPGRLGGFADHNYQYDNLYRLTGAQGLYRGATDSSAYGLTMKYDNLYNIVRKSMFRSQSQAGYDLSYNYDASPHRPSKIGEVNYRYDENGNQLGYSARQNFWDEENRLIAAITGGTLSRYTYDATGERVIKSSGGLQGIWVNGAPAGLINHDSNYVAYVSPYLVCRRTGFTKHIYIESQRIATKIGIGRFTNISFPHTALTAGGINYIKRAGDIQKQRYDYYAGLGVSPGPPTDKYFFAQPYNSGIQPPVIMDTTAASIPAGWPGNTTAPPFGPPVFVSPIPSNDSVKAGYGFITTGHFYEQNQYFYHPDHLGSTSYVTDLSGEVSQHQEYSAFGETFFEEHSKVYETPYLFNAKERDAETGLYYYGARYYDPRTSIWISVDPRAEKYPGVSPYNYALLNPVRLIDPDGREPELIEGKSWAEILHPEGDKTNDFKRPRDYFKRKFDTDKENNKSECKDLGDYIMKAKTEIEARKIDQIEYEKKGITSETISHNNFTEKEAKRINKLENQYYRDCNDPSGGSGSFSVNVDALMRHEGRYHSQNSPNAGFMNNGIDWISNNREAIVTGIATVAVAAILATYQFELLPFVAPLFAR